MSRNVRFDLPAVRVVDGDLSDALKRFDRRWKASRIKKELVFRAENPTRAMRRRAKVRKAKRRWE